MTTTKVKSIRELSCSNL